MKALKNKPQIIAETSSKNLYNYLRKHNLPAD